MPAPPGVSVFEGPGDYTTTKTIHGDTYDAISPSKLDLSGRAVFITGASRGIGKEIAAAYARAGASYIAVGARSSLSSTTDAVKQAAKDAGRAEPKVLALKLDVADGKSVQAFAKQIEQDFGRLDVVVNNAGAMAKVGLIHDTDPEEWWKVTEINLRGTYLVTHACLPLLLKPSDGLKTLVAIGSVGGLLSTPGASAYQTSKMAVMKFSEAIAADYRDQGIIAYTVHPGSLITELIYDSAIITPEIEAMFPDTPPLPADTIAFLTAERREWLSGRYITAIWDMPELLARKDEIVGGDKLRVKFDILSPI